MAQQSVDPLVCCWEECCVTRQNVDDFYNHVPCHLPQIRIVTQSDGNESYQCGWQDCDHQTTSSAMVTQHVKFHGYHTILKAKGSFFARKNELFTCTYEADSTFMTEWSLPLVCQWGECTEVSSGPLEFFCHVRQHLNSVDASNSTLRCLWQGCKMNTARKTKLVDHVKAHTHEKALACHVCGNTFANNTKFANHCSRQAPIDESSFQCSYCLSLFPNARLLNHHMRQHIHHYKCCSCDMTFNTPSALARHIRYRHLPYKPFKCSTCSRTFKSQSDLKQHFAVHTNDYNYITCNEADCDFKCRSHPKLLRHYYQVHAKTEEEKDARKLSGKYCCHLCDSKYNYGCKLTKHLMKSHNVTKPSSYSRFIYRDDGNGSFKLQTVRYESLLVEDDGSRKSGKNEEDTESDVDDPCEMSNQPHNPSEAIVEVMKEDGDVISVNVVNTNVPPSEGEVILGFPDSGEVL